MSAAEGKRLRYREIANDIRQGIAAGRLEPGSRVGTFGSLQHEYDAAKGTVDRALAELRQEGLVVSIAGKGIFVAESATRELGDSPPLDDRFAALEERVGELEAKIMDIYAHLGLPRVRRHDTGSAEAV